MEALSLTLAFMGAAMGGVAGAGLGFAKLFVENFYNRNAQSHIKQFAAGGAIVGALAFGAAPVVIDSLSSDETTLEDCVKAAPAGARTSLEAGPNGPVCKYTP